MNRLRRLLPTPDAIRNNRWLQWLGPAIHHPRLWHLSRRGLALGMALGFFFGLLVPLAQIPLSAAAAVALRANLPVAIASTLVSNPLTFGPIYYAAWRTGRAVLGEPVRDGEVPPALDADETASPIELAWWDKASARLLGVGKPLLVGLAILATGLGVSTYFAASALWVLRVRWKRRRRLRAARA